MFFLVVYLMEWGLNSLNFEFDLVECFCRVLIIMFLNIFFSFIYLGLFFVYVLGKNYLYNEK